MSGTKQSIVTPDSAPNPEDPIDAMLLRPCKGRMPCTQPEPLKENALVEAGARKPTRLDEPKHQTHTPQLRQTLC